jgi:hypothetical protein
MNSRFALPGSTVLKPPNGGVSFCRPSSADLRSSGSCASAARPVTDFASVPARCLAQPGALIARAICAGRRANRSFLARGGIAGFEGVEMVGHHLTIVMPGHSTSKTGVNALVPGHPSVSPDSFS